MKDRWIFSLEKFMPEDLELFKNFTQVSLNEVMAFLGRIIVDGPVEVDWSDRYGWTILSIPQMGQLFTQAMETINRWGDQWQHMAGDQTHD